MVTLAWLSVDVYKRQGIDTNLSSGTKAGVATMAVGAMAAKKMGGGVRNFAVGRYRCV